MIVKETGFEGLLLLEPQIFEDNRGYFFESFNEQKFRDAGVPSHYVQDNQSYSEKGVIRGLHFQKAPYEQGKLVRVLAGKVLDVVVDIRPDSKTFGQHFKCVLDAVKNNMMYIPGGFAHGFAALENTVFFYKCTGYYNKEAESGIVWNDEELQIDWEVENPVLSEKDQQLPRFKELFGAL